MLAPQSAIRQTVGSIAKNTEMGKQTLRKPGAATPTGAAVEVEAGPDGGSELE
jgi:hypothetical protein